jgi:hypothetical protein
MSGGGVAFSRPTILCSVVNNKIHCIVAASTSAFRFYSWPSSDVLKSKEYLNMLYDADEMIWDFVCLYA